jgi:hypothetical protein
MFKRNFWVKPAFLVPVLLAVALLTGCPTDPPPPSSSPPAKPVITSVVPGDEQLTVTWGAVSEATSYEVYHNTTNTTTGATQFGGDITVTTTTITGLTNYNTYHVWIRAKNSAGTSGYSVSKSGIPTDILLVTVTSGNAQLTVNWNTIGWATSYEVYHSTSNDIASATKLSSDPTEPNATISSLTNGTVYYVWVRAKKEERLSDYSAVVEAAAFDMPVSDGMYKSAALPTDAGGYGNDWYIIEDGVVSHYYEGDSLDFAGQLANYHDGVIIAKITEIGEYEPTVGKFYGLLCNDVTSFSFTGANAYKEGGNNDGMDTLSAASAEYTSSGGYFGTTADYGLYAGTATVTGIDQSLEVVWTAVPSAENYDVYYGSTTTLPTSETSPNASSVSGTITTISSLSNDTAYNVWARAKTSSVTGAWVYQGSGTPEEVVLPDIGYFKGDILPPYDDGIGISATHFYYYDDGALTIGYAGEIVKHIPVGSDGTAGTLIIKITDGGTWSKTVGNYYAVVYRNYGYAPAMQVIRIQTSSAYKGGGNDSGLPTIAEAITEYTAANGYYTKYGDYRKFREEVPVTDGTLTLTGLEGAWSGENEEEDTWAIRIANPVLTWSEDLFGYSINHQFAGTIVETTDATQSSGYIYIKVDFVNTTAVGYYKTLVVGNYLTIHWKDKDTDSISLCAAYTENITGTSTLSDAKSTYTTGNTYFDDDAYVNAEIVEAESW